MTFSNFPWQSIRVILVSKSAVSFFCVKICFLVPFHFFFLIVHLLPFLCPKRILSLWIFSINIIFNNFPWPTIKIYDFSGRETKLQNSTTSQAFHDPYEPCNLTQIENQSSLARTRFPALDACCMYVLWVLMNWFITLPTFVVIGQNHDYFGFGFTTVNWKPLWLLNLQEEKSLKKSIALASLLPGSIMVQFEEHPWTTCRGERKNLSCFRFFYTIFFFKPILLLSETGKHSLQYRGATLWDSSLWNTEDSGNINPSKPCLSM